MSDMEGGAADATFAGYLRQLMTERNLTVRTLAQETGVSEDSIIRWREGKKEPSSATLGKLLAQLPATDAQKERLCSLIHAARGRQELVHSRDNLLLPHTGALVRSLVARAGLRKSDAARLLGVPPSRITEWGNGSRKVPPERIPDIARVVGATPEETQALRSQLTAPRQFILPPTRDFDELWQVVDRIGSVAAYHQRPYPSELVLLQLLCEVRH